MTIESFGEVLHRLRIESKLSQTELAVKSGTTQATFCHFEHNRQEPTEDQLENIILSFRELSKERGFAWDEKREAELESAFGHGLKQMSLHLGQYVKTKRKQANLSQAQLAKKLRISLVTLRHLENGQVALDRALWRSFVEAVPDSSLDELEAAWVKDVQAPPPPSSKKHLENWAKSVINDVMSRLPSKMASRLAMKLAKAASERR